MGFFRPDYAKTGKGVEKKEQELRPFFQFFVLYFRKIAKLIGLNMAYFVIFFPTFCFFVNRLMYALSLYLPNFSFDTLNSEFLKFVFFISISLPVWANCILVGLSVLLCGPARAGMAYLMKHYVRGESCFYWSDFGETAVKNAKQSIFFGILDFVITTAFLQAFTFSASPDNAMLGQYLVLARVALLIVLVYYSIMRYYIYPMMVFVNLKISHIIKNASLFFVLGLWRNVVAILANGLFIYLTLNFDFIVFPFLAFATCRYIASFLTHPVLDKHLIRPLMEKAGYGETETEAVFSDKVQ